MGPAGLQIHSSDYQNHGAQLIDGIDPLPPTRPPSRADNSNDASQQTGNQAGTEHDHVKSLLVTNLCV